MALFTPGNREELTERGFTVVQEVLTGAECDQYRQQYMAWIKDNFEEGSFPETTKSLVNPAYKMGHLATSWAIRLRCKRVFTELWGTDKLLTSFDTVAIGRPPEQGVEEFWSGDCRWLHIDESIHPDEKLRCFQGAVYLENAEIDDWTLEVLDGSHKLFDEFWKSHPEAVEFCNKNKTGVQRSYHFPPDVVDWFLKRGCILRRVAVPKGALVLWDSRTAHGNANPIRGRPHKARWRWVLIVSMWPVSLVGPEGAQKRKQAYDAILPTGHDLRVKAAQDLKISPKQPITELSEIAQSVEARRLAGAEPYPET